MAANRSRVLYIAIPQPKGSSQVAFSLVDLRRLRPRKHVVLASAVGRRPADTPPTGIPSYESSTIRRRGRVAARLRLECVDRMYLKPRQRRVPAARRRRGKLLASGGGLQGCPAGRRSAAGAVRLSCSNGPPIGRRRGELGPAGATPLGSAAPTPVETRTEETPVLGGKLVSPANP